MDFVFIISVLKTSVFVLMCFLYFPLFFKYDTVYKLISIYLFINTCIKVIYFFVPKENNWNIVFLVLQFYVISGIYYLLLKKQSYFIYIFIVSSILFTGELLFSKLPYIQIISTGIIITYLLIIVFSNIYHFSQLKEEKRYYYFNTGLFFFVFLSIISFCVFFSARIITQNLFYDKLLEISLNLFEMFLCYFLIKEWLFLKKMSVNR